MKPSAEFLVERLLYRGKLMLVINKPAGLPVHRGASGGPCLEDYFEALKFGLPHVPALAHRLDRDTTGCLILGRTPKALSKLGKLFSAGQIEKTYWAIVEGKPEKPSGRIDAPLRKVSSKQSWKIEIAEENDPTAQKAATTYRTLVSKEGRSLIECKPKTGRTHQIRVHLMSIGCPIIGDEQYGVPGDAMMLHARRVIVPISSKMDDAVICVAPPPETMSPTLKQLGIEF